EFLYVTTTKEVIQIPVAHCEKYNTTCEGCVMTRDPYCAWNTVEKKCVRTANNSK
ncbi:hypothetical protein scyTo_0026204, partial [Scyliorhinus torazame]|nr:hypothetical protein [Scyliorhinus torazame]